MLKEAEREPLATGVKVMFTVQEAFTARVPGLTGQLLVCVKSVTFVPVMLTLEIVSGLGPLLVTVTGVGALDVVTF